PGVPAAGGTPGFAFSDLTHGALGVDANGRPDGTGVAAFSQLIVNVNFSGTGTNNVLHFHVNGSVSSDACVGIDCGSTLQASVTMGNIFTDGRFGAAGKAGAEICAGDVFDGCTPGGTFPVDLTLSFDVSPDLHEFQFLFFMFGAANGFASAT